MQIVVLFLMLVTELSMIALYCLYLLRLESFHLSAGSVARIRSLMTMKTLPRSRLFVLPGFLFMQ